MQWGSRNSGQTSSASSSNDSYDEQIPKVVHSFTTHLASELSKGLRQIPQIVLGDLCNRVNLFSGSDLYRVVPHPLLSGFGNSASNHPKNMTHSDAKVAVLPQLGPNTRGEEKLEP